MTVMMLLAVITVLSLWVGGDAHSPRPDAVVIQLGEPPSRVQGLRDRCAEMFFRTKETDLTRTERLQLAVKQVGTDLIADLPTALKTGTMVIAALVLAIRFPRGIPILVALALFAVVMRVSHTLYANRVRLGLMPLPVVAVFAAALLFTVLALVGLIHDEIADFKWSHMKGNLGF